MARGGRKGRGKGRGGGGGGGFPEGRAPAGGFVKRPDNFDKKREFGGRGGGRGGAWGHDDRGDGGPRKGRGKGRGGKGAGGGRGGPNRYLKPNQRTGPGSTLPPAPVVDMVREEGLLRHQELKAHTDAIMAVCITADCVYSASRDKMLKRWKVQKNAQGRFELVPEIEIPLGEQCWSMLYVGEWLFCGLGDGSIRGYKKDGNQQTGRNHTKRVTALLVHEAVLISGSSDGAIGLWQMGADGNSFSCTHSITEGITGSCTCLAVLQGHLWCGGTSGIAIVELTSLKVVKQLPPKKFVASFVTYEGHLIVSYADGSLVVFDAGGNVKHTQQALPAGPVLAMCGLEVGPRLLLGHAKGQVSSIGLPMFEFKRWWQALEKCKVQTLCAVGSDGIFIVGAENGNLQVWQRDGSVG
eukprot:gnl/TRDRNA2_/TRDRNA2_193013_c0_seq1.p1 gnl/TRDRNA2_/TRDRNA2_193013_c0~~gnl/TRDRNA2_/TRDRNA2_193013_c0_seq1.p1  ORF type:complete len:445 (+),score=74.23 gnl/TRDRNA2_/TRDRNA2_193013_c0_seq1:106-1335(+)